MKKNKKAYDLEVVQDLEPKKKVQHEFDLNKPYVYEDGEEFHPGVVQEIEKPKKVQHRFDLNKIYVYEDGEEFDINEKSFYHADDDHLDEETQKVVRDMLRIYVPSYFK